MPRKRVKELTKGQFNRQVVEEAVKSVRAGKSLREAAKECNLSKSTLQRYVKSTKDQEDLSDAKLTPNHACRRVLTSEMEDQLANYLIDCAKMGFGLDTIQVRQLAFQMVKLNTIEHPSSWDEGVDWLYGFRQRHPALSMRKQEPCSTRASAFTPENMQVFFGNLKIAMDRQPSFADGSRGFNLDEIGTTTVGSVKRKILAPAGIKQIPQSKTAERGTLVTTVGIIGGNGTALPPVMVFPRVNFVEHMLVDAYPGTLGLAAPSGWMNAEIFPRVIEHFVKHTSSSKQNPTLLIMDNDSSHLSIEALNIAKENGVTFLTLSPHTSHKTQPLDVAVFSPFRTYYDSAMRSWTMSNPGQKVTIYHVASFLRAAMEKAMTPGTILSGFRKTGIFPFDPDIFTEADFIAAAPFRESTSPSAAATTSTATATTPDEARASTSASPAGASGNAASPPDQDVQPGPSGSQSFVGPYEFRGLPKVAADTRGAPRQNRRRGRSMIPTDTPEKAQLEAQKAAAQARRSKSSGPGKRASKTKTAWIPAKKGKVGKQKSPSPASSSDEDDPDAVPLADSDASMTWAEEEDNGPTIVDPASLGQLEGDPKEEDYVLLQEVKQKGKKKKREVTYRIAKVLTSPPKDGTVEVSLLKKSEKVKDKFMS